MVVTYDCPAILVSASFHLVAVAHGPSVTQPRPFGPDLKWSPILTQRRKSDNQHEYRDGYPRYGTVATALVEASEESWVK